MDENPLIAFGLNCAAMALRAKLGVLGRGEAMKLVLLSTRLVPDDEAAAQAVSTFAQRCVQDQPGAGAALHDFIIGWRGGVILVPDPAPARHPWQERADLA